MASLFADEMVPMLEAGMSQRDAAEVLHRSVRHVTRSRPLTSSTESTVRARG